MPLQSSGAISFSQIRGEWGGAGVTRMSQLYVNGGIVPNDGFCTNGTIPASGPIRFSNFYNTTNGTRYYVYGNPSGVTPTLLFPPVYTTRAQVQMLGGGGGAACTAYVLYFGSVPFARAIRVTGGGGGGYTFQQMTVIQQNSEYLAITVGAGGSALYRGPGQGAATAGSGGLSRVCRGFSGAQLACSNNANGGGGGFSNVITSWQTPNDARGGFGGTGTNGNGGAGALGNFGSVFGQSAVNITSTAAGGGGAINMPGTSTANGDGGNGSVTMRGTNAAISGPLNAGIAGAIRVRI